MLNYVLSNFMFNDREHNKNIGLTLSFDEKDSSPTTKVFSMCRNKLRLGSFIIEDLNNGKFNLKSKLPEQHVLLQFIWNQQGRIEFWIAINENSTLKNRTYTKAKEWLTVTSFLGPLFLRLNNLTATEVFENINPLVKHLPFYNEKYWNERNLDENLRFESLDEFFSHHSINSSGVRNGILSYAKNFKHMLELCNALKALPVEL